MAIAGAGADIIFTSSNWPADLVEVITGRDTLASWWRNQEVGWGLQDHFDDHFKAWAQGSPPSTDSRNSTWRKLRAASLLAGTAADHSAWQHTTSLLARHNLTFTAGGSKTIARSESASWPSVDDPGNWRWRDALSVE